MKEEGNVLKANVLKVTVKKEKTKVKSKTEVKPKDFNIELSDDSGKKGITSKSFTKIDTLYSYSYGKIMKAKLKGKDKDDFLVIKKIRKRDIYKAKQLKSVEEEINLIKQCDSPFILKMPYTFQDKQYIYMAEDYCQGGNLKWHITSNLFEEEEAKFFIAELILAIEHLHKKNLIFKNLKSEKILINNKNHIQLIGYGICKENKDTKNAENKPLEENNFLKFENEYISPQIQAIKGEGKVADIYGIGEVLYEMICGTKPFYAKENMNLYSKNCKKYKLMMSEYFSIEIKNLLIKLLCTEPKDRIGVKDIGDIKKHVFFKNFDWGRLGKMQLSPPIDLCKRKLQHKNLFGFNKKKKKKKINILLEPEMVKKVQRYTFFSKIINNDKNDKTFINGIINDKNDNDELIINTNVNKTDIIDDS